MNTQWVILAGVSGYVLVMFSIAFWSSRRVKTLTDFLVAGQD